MARAKRDKRYQLPKNRIIIPLIIYTLIFFIACGIISLSGDLIATYATKLKNYYSYLICSEIFIFLKFLIGKSTVPVNTTVIAMKNRMI